MTARSIALPSIAVLEEVVRIGAQRDSLSPEQSRELQGFARELVNRDGPDARIILNAIDRLSADGRNALATTARSAASWFRFSRPDYFGLLSVARVARSSESALR